MQKGVKGSCTYVAQHVDGKNCGPKPVVAKTNIFCPCPVIVNARQKIDMYLYNLILITSKIADFLAEFHYF